MSNTNQNTQTNSSNEKWFRKADYRKVALTRFDDAVALYSAEQYEGSFYLSGYVIEIGAKAKMAELAKTKLSDMTAPMIWRIIDEWTCKCNKNKEDSSLDCKHCSPNSEPLTIYEFGKYFFNLGVSLTTKKDGKQPKALYNLLQEDSTHYMALSEGRVYDRDGKEPFHAPSQFLKTVGEWAKLLGKQESYYSEFEYIADKFETLGWGTSLRYGESMANNPEEVAKQALSIAYRFLMTCLLSGDELEQAKYRFLGERLNLTTTSV